MKPMTLLNLIDQLNNRQTTSLELVKFYTEQIKTLDFKYNAVAQLNPDALNIAKQLDDERRLIGPRSLLHGIPLLLKDNIQTSDYMNTTCNSIVLKDFRAPFDATIVKKLRDAGAIILGKANLSEFAYFMSDEQMPSGYGSLHGQVKNPYDERIDPLGSSTGSAVSVAANLIPIAIGTETNGSLMAPAYQNGIVSMKPTLGLVSRHGIVPISEKQDTAGPMAKTVADCAILLDSMVGYDPHDQRTRVSNNQSFDFKTAYLSYVKGNKVGILHFENHPYSDEEKKVLLEVEQVLKVQGLLVEHIPFVPNQIDNTATLLYDFKHDLNAYLKKLGNYTPVKSLSDIISFNALDPKKRLKYGQSLFIKSDQTSGNLEDDFYLLKRKEILKEASRFEYLLKEKNLSALISTKWTSYAPVYGNPSICVPGKVLDDLKPIGVVFVGRLFEDATLISIAHQYEKMTQHYRLPIDKTKGQI